MFKLMIRTMLLVILLVAISLGVYFLQIPYGFRPIGGRKYVNTENNTIFLRNGTDNFIFTQLFNADGTPMIMIWNED